MSVRLVVAAAVLAGAGVAPFAVSADASPQVQDSGTLSRAAAVPTKPGKNVGWIQGKVLDRAQRPIQNINVEAFKADNLKGTPVASSLTYAPTYRDEKGWYRLYGLKPGKYKVRYSSLSNAKKPYQAVWSQVVTVTKQKTVELSAQTMTLTTKVDASLALVFSDASVKPSQRAKLKISLTSADVSPIAGDLYVKIDKQPTWTTPIKDENRGHLTVRLPKQALGQHQISVRFGGNDAVNRTKKPVKITLWVTRSGR